MLLISGIFAILRRHLHSRVFFVLTCHTRFLKENRMHNYMYAKIKFHTYSDVIMAKWATMSRKRDLQQLKDLSEIHSFNWKRRLYTSQAIDRGLHAPRNLQSLMDTPSTDYLGLNSVMQGWVHLWLVLNKWQGNNIYYM